MINRIHFIQIIFFIFLLTACQLSTITQDNHEKNGVLETPPTIETSALPWTDLLVPLISDMLTVSQPMSVSKLLISDIRNNTGQYIPRYKINKIIATQLEQQSQYIIIDKPTINKGKRALGLAFDDTLVSRSKMIALARYLGTDLVLFSAIDELTKDLTTPPKVTMEVLSTKTGEIIWRKSNHQLLTVPQFIDNNPDKVIEQEITPSSNDKNKDNPEF